MTYVHKEHESKDVRIVREALVNYGTWRMQKPRREKAFAALDRLEARIEEERERFRTHVETMIEPKLLARAEAAEARCERLEGALREKDGQPILNAARRLVRATDNAERNAALGDLYNVIVAEEPYADVPGAGQRGCG